jgi:predicted RNA-binding protein YlqC (UPF0109 family)
MLKELIEQLVSSLVDEPQAVQIREIVQDNKHIIEVSVAANDLKRVIGKEGRVIRALRGIAQCYEPLDKEIVLDIAK